MRDLSNATGIGTGIDFLNGDLVDNQTLINEFINQDPIQFFQKLADLAGIVFNDLPDNETNDYQLIEALETVVRSYVATTLLKGTVEQAIQAESDAGTPDKFPDAAAMLSTILSNILAANGGLITAPEIEIGDWDMNVSVDGIAQKVVAHGIVDWTKIRRVTAFIRDDIDTITRYPINTFGSVGTSPAGSVISVGTSNVVLQINTGEFFDSATFDTDTAYNRGWIIVEYLP